MTLIRDINNILKYGRMTSSLKISTLLSIIDYVIEHPNEKPKNNFHFIPIVYLAKKLISYYFPLYFIDLKQGSFAEDKRLAIFGYIEDFLELLEGEEYNNSKNLNKIATSGPKGIFWFNELFDTPEVLPKPVIGLLWKVRRKLIKMPLGKIHKVRGEEIRFFSLLTEGVNFHEEFSTHLSRSLELKKFSTTNWEGVREAEKSYLIIDDLTYQELTKYSLWAREVTLKAWFDYSAKRARNKDKDAKLDAKFFTVIGYAYMEDYPRDTGLMVEYKKIYNELNLNRCLYSGREFKQGENYDLDHFLPWSFYPVNRFWNLYPSDPIINRKKSNYLPAWSDLLEKRMRAHLAACLGQRKNKYLSNDLTYFYHYIQKDKEFDYLNAEEQLIEDDLLIHIKKDWTYLYNSKPGMLYEYNCPAP